tara:strand:+ start:1975 stop:2340 length:366 start_codon:yes stop_codon:yes gene_type:complete
VAKERLQTQSLSKQLQIYKNGNFGELAFHALDVSLLKDMARLDEFYTTITEANEPSIMDQNSRDILDKVNHYRLGKNEELTIITQDELDFLSTTKGKFIPSLKKKIKSHAVHTQNFLNHIP